MTEPDDLVEARQLINYHLKPHGINVDITFRGNGDINLTATKHIGMRVKHITIDGIDLLDSVWQLIQYILDEIEDWLEEETYGS